MGFSKRGSRHKPENIRLTTLTTFTERSETSTQDFPQSNRASSVYSNHDGYTSSNLRPQEIEPLHYTPRPKAPVIGESLEERTRDWSLARLKQELKHRSLSIGGNEAKLRQRVILAHQYDEGNGWVWNKVAGSFYKRIPFDGEGINPSTLVGHHMDDVTKLVDGTIILRFADIEDHRVAVNPIGSSRIYFHLLPFPREGWMTGELKMVMEATGALCQCVRETAASTVKTIGFRFEGSDELEFLRCWRNLGMPFGHVYLDDFWNPLDI